jgi:hypothetical protein
MLRSGVLTEQDEGPHSGGVNSSIGEEEPGIL